LNHPWLNSDVEHNLGDARSKNLQHFRHAAKLKQILITNVAEHLSAEKKQKFIRDFRDADRNNSGFIEKEELIAYCEKSNKHNANEQANEILTKINPKVPNAISLVEFVRYQMSTNELCLMRLSEEMFKAAGGSDNNPITRDALRAYILEHYKNFEKDEVEGFVQTITCDESGRIPLANLQKELKILRA